MRLYRCAFRYHEGGREMVNTFHLGVQLEDLVTWGFTGAPSPEEVADEVSSHLTTKFRAILTTGAVLHDLTVMDEQDPLDPGAAREGHVKSLELAGTRAESNRDQPLEMCGVATLRTGKIGRSFRGRMFLPPVVSESAVTTTTFTTAGDYWLACIAFLNDFIPSFGGGSVWSTLFIDSWHASPVVYSRTRRARGEDQWANVVDSFRLNRAPHWLRSRGE